MKLAAGLTTLALAMGANLISKKVGSYETGDLANPSIHPLLVEKLKNFYQLPSGIDFLLRRVQEGSINEDSPAEPIGKQYSRSLNHFQHWQTGRGLECEFNYCNVIRPEGVDRLLSSTEWTSNSEVQSSYPFGDHTWEKVKEDYRLGIVSEHFGYLFHVISDLTVPAHVRNDVHAAPWDKDDFEVWTHKHRNEIMHLVQPQEVPTASSLEELMAETANFTGSNFYSDDSRDGTIGRLTPLVEGNKVYLTKEVKGKRVRIFRTALVLNFADDNCWSDQWSVLGKEAVERGAGALRLLESELQPVEDGGVPCTPDPRTYCQDNTVVTDDGCGNMERVSCDFGWYCNEREMRCVIRELENLGDGTLLDQATNLLWEQSSSASWQTNSCQSALSYCENRELAEYSDWRLPTYAELLTLLLDEPESHPSLVGGCCLSSLFNPSCSGPRTAYWIWPSNTGWEASAYRFEANRSGECLTIHEESSSSCIPSDNEWHARCVRNVIP